ncbi:hypothetical protein HU200_016767 [Digitaria exilis]|uniref:Uncharacterized protein n=1 Tax=Digitaria exilis TaxID=1010633 RepID=A0A835F7D0_9POAL|nr:hypothetical protein HU200_016767 [Digitaria exilis]
MCSYRRIF